MTGIQKTTRPNNLLTIKESQARRERPMSGFGLWRLGFRPFYLGSALFSAAAILFWLGILSGHMAMPATSINPVFWHAHEMVFGFALAVIAGFLLTASNNWTGILPAAGMPLASVFLLWALARLFIIIGNLPLAAAADISFALLLVGLLFRVLWLAKLWKNFTLLGLVALMGIFNAWFYAMVLTDQPGNPLFPIELALLVVMQILVIMGGRVIPNFTQNGVPGITIWKPPFFVIATPVITAMAILAWLTLPPRLALVTCLVAAGVNFSRWVGWKPWKTLKHPMVWVLQLGYLWIPITLLTMGLDSVGIVLRSLPIHTLAVGAIGLIIAGMITRTAMGHTGRQISASRLELGFFLLIAISGLLRALAATQLWTPTQVSGLLLASGTAWSLGFLVYACRYAPWLFRPRIDGRPG